MIYTVNAVLRNKAGKELGHRTPLVKTEQPELKGAIKAAHLALGPIVPKTAGLDSIVLHIKDEKGGVTTTTEYAEDFTIGYGASAIGGSGLLTDAIDFDLTVEQKAAAQDLIRQRAIDALKPELKAEDKFTEPITKATESLREMVSKSDKLKEMIEDAQKKTGAAWDEIKRKSQMVMDELEEIRRAGTKMVRLNADTWKLYCFGMKFKFGYNVNDTGSGSWYGGDLYVTQNYDPNGPPIQVVREPRAAPRTTESGRTRKGSKHEFYPRAYENPMAPRKNKSEEQIISDVVGDATIKGGYQSLRIADDVEMPPNLLEQLRKASAAIQADTRVRPPVLFPHQEEILKGLEAESERIVNKYYYGNW